MSEFAGEILKRQAAAYVRSRPDYPVEIEGWMRTELGIDEGKFAVDIGSGTGKFLPRLLATGAEVVAVEPLAAMRSHLIARNPGVGAIAARVQALPLADCSVDVVSCAQCFHLFATADALKEIQRVLKPGGVLLLAWNIRDSAKPWVAHVIEIMAPYDDQNTPHYESSAWKAAFPATGFSELQNIRFANPQTGPAEKIIVDRVLSTHSIAKLPKDERDRIVTRLWNLIAASPELAEQPAITFPNHCYAYWCRKEE
jgi:SAM-dependent methyltransferase